MQRFLPLLFVLLTLVYCAQQPETTGPIYPERDIDLEPAAAADLASKIRTETNVEVVEDFELTLWASDTLVADPVAISVAPDGRIFYTSANRPISSEFDIRGHRDWMTASISFETVEDRREFLRKTFEADSDQSERHLKDLNEDGVRDWRDLTVEKDEVWFVEDRSGNGVADHAKLYIEDFNEEVTDVTNGVEYHNGEVYISVGPDLWKTADTDDDGIADEKESISHGWIVHIGFGGHGMSGVTVGPQGRIWWGGGDVGMNVIDKDGKEHKYPNEGTIVRCDPDGKNFEVFAHGLRNTHEFVFDDLGNLITEDNDGDHSGESERLVYLIDGSDSGWRINWQFGKYTDPTNNDYKVWMEERMYEPRWEGQAAYFLPPIQNYVNGPTGFVYNPGTALGPEYYQHFFVAEFRGNPANSPVHAFTLEPEGAGFKLGSTKQVVSGLLPTGLDFGPDGALYFSDWINGWNPKQEGRIWKLDVPGGADQPIRREVKRLLNLRMDELGTDSLELLLAHQDQRVRKNAQFELVTRGEEGYQALLRTARSGENQLARIHGIWGIGQMARVDIDLADELASLLGDSDPEIVAQSARMIGDVRMDGAGDQLIDLLDREEPRVVFMATEALGRTDNQDAVQPILDMLERNDDQDIYLRMVGMIALGRIGQSDPLVALKDSPSRALRTAAVVALRRMESPEIAQFLQDEDEYIVAEAARGINDDYSIPDALPALAATLDDPRFTSEALLRRAINANVRVGAQESVERLVAYAGNGNAPAELRAEAISALSVWAHPSVFDRVDGRYRGEFEQDSTVAAAALAPKIAELMSRGDEAVRTAAIEAAGKLNLQETIPQLTELLSRDRSTLVRTAALNALNDLGAPDLDQNLETALADRDGNVRARALEILPSSGISGDRSVLLYDKVLERGTVVEQQAALLGLSQIEGESADELFGRLLDRLEADNIPTEVKLDLAEAVEQHGNPQLNAILTDYAGTVDSTLGLYAFALEGGNAGRGRNLFYRNESAQCVRCHAIFEYGANVGPGLEGIADRLDQRQLLEALIRPSARLAPGYETILVTMNDGTVTAGTVMKRTPDEITLKIGKEDIQTLQRSDISEEETVPSSMPSMEERLDRREIRDLVAFLSTLHAEES
ncbi:HEAT repeat domain-containing protein [Lewinella sp. IMCC34191]|uniref:HEAT repeat domain-containing protein n=1 Tax=Lewinella sp. IMCC34191 TaxID=2259172 RepID=UPI000E26F318|nr:HEAT repeat domain-containing protein [Lewinella sp. IMCC34191]